jgi:hypothetical protein
MDRKLKSLLKGAGLDSLMGGKTLGDLSKEISSTTADQRNKDIADRNAKEQADAKAREAAAPKAAAPQTRQPDKFVSDADMPIYMKATESARAAAAAKTPEEKATLEAKKKQDWEAYTKTDSFKKANAPATAAKAAQDARMAQALKDQEAAKAAQAARQAAATEEFKKDKLTALSESLSSGSYNPDPNNYKLLGELVFYKGHEDPKGGYPYWKNDSTTEGTDGPPPYLAKTPATLADYQFWYDHLSPSLREFITKFWSMNRTVLVDRHQNETPEEFEKTKADMLKQLETTTKTDNTIGKRVSKTPNEILRDQWIAFHLKQLPFWKRAEEYVAKDPIYRNVMGQEQWAAVVKNNVAEWQERVNDAVNPQVKASLISEFGEYQRLNASYDAYVANENAKPPPPSYKGKDISEATKGVAEEDVKFDKREQIKKIRDADLETEREVAQKTATLNGMKTGNPINDQEIDEALAYIKWGEELREQISMWELAGANKDMTLADYWDSLGEPEMIDVEAEVEKEKQQIQNRINDYKKSAQYVLDQIKKWGMLVIDIGVNFLPYILPFPVGNVIQLGYQAFAPVGSIYHTEGSFTQKLQAGLVNGAEQAVLGLIGLGRKGRRKYMKTLMESEGGGEMGQERQIEDDSRSHHALHAKTPAGSQRRRKAQRQT